MPQSNGRFVDSRRVRSALPHNAASRTTTAAGRPASYDNALHLSDIRHYKNCHCSSLRAAATCLPMRRLRALTRRGLSTLAQESSASGAASVSAAAHAPPLAPPSPLAAAELAAAPAAVRRSFYKRALPRDLVPFASPEGKRIFRDALEDGSVESFFPLVQHFQTQSEPASCALGTLSMASSPPLPALLRPAHARTGAERAQHRPGALLEGALALVERGGERPRRRRPGGG